MRILHTMLRVGDLGGILVVDGQLDVVDHSGARPSLTPSGADRR